MTRYGNFSRNARIVALRKGGLWPTQIADAMGLSRNTIIGVLNRAGLCSADTDNREIQRQKVKRGEDCHSAKLTHEIAAEIRASYTRYCRTNGTGGLARKYGVANTTILAVVSGKSWQPAKGRL